MYSFLTNKLLIAFLRLCLALISRHNRNRSSLSSKWTRIRILVVQGQDRCTLPLWDRLETSSAVRGSPFCHRPRHSTFFVDTLELLFVYVYENVKWVFNLGIFRNVDSSSLWRSAIVFARGMFSIHSARLGCAPSIPLLIIWPRNSIF